MSDLPNAPIIQEVTIPAAPVLVEPEVTLLELIEPSVPSLQTVTGTAAPEQSTETFGQTFAQIAAGFESVFNAALTDALLDLLAYVYDDSEWELTRETIVRKYLTEKKKLLEQEGAKNLPLLSGPAQRKLLDLDLAERHELSRAYLDLYDKKSRASQENLSYAIGKIAEVEGLNLEGHFKQQSANLEIAVLNAKMLVDAANTKIKLYNEYVRGYGAWMEQQGALNKVAAQEAQLAIEEAKASGIFAENEQLALSLQNALTDFEITLEKVKATSAEAKTIQASIYRTDAITYQAEAEAAAATAQASAAAGEAAVAKGRGQLAKLDTLRAQIASARAQLDTQRAERKKTMAQAYGDLESAKAQFEADLAAFDFAKEKLDLSIRKARVQVQKYQSELLQNEARVEKSLVEQKVEVAEIEADVKIQKAGYLTQIQNDAKYNLNAFLENLEATVATTAANLRASTAIARAELEGAATVTANYIHKAGSAA